MTTIATDGKSIAADGRTTSENVVVTDVNDKLVRLPDGSVVGGAGQSPALTAAIRALHADPHREPVFDGEHVTLVRLYPSGAVRHYSGHHIPIWADPPVVVGSGGDIALGAMLAGASPKRAVAIAAQRDVWSGGRIQSIKVRR